MLHGRVVRVNGGTISKAKNATFQSFDDLAARAIPGYVQTVQKGNFVGVVATTEWAAIQAAKALQVTWTNGAPLASNSVEANLQAALTNGANVYSPNRTQEVVGHADGDEAVDKRMKAFGAFGEPLQHIINAYAYGDVWSRPALPLATKSLAMVAMMAGAGRTNELRVHVKGALTNGCSAEQIQDILLLVAMYCGIPAANEAHRIAVDVLRETEAK